MARRRYARLVYQTKKKDCVLVRVNWFEFYSFISINPPARGTTLVQVFLDMVPAEATNLFYINYLYKTSIYEVLPGNRRYRV